MHTIDVVGKNPNATPSSVAKELMVTLGTVTTSLNNLERKGYIERTRSEVDRRVVHLNLTKNGRLIYRLHRRFSPREWLKESLKEWMLKRMKVMGKGLD